jgi:uncharacterized protein
MMNRRQFSHSLALILSLPAILMGQNKPEPAMPALPTQQILIHVHTDRPADWQRVLTKANEYVSTGAPGATYVEILLTGDGLKLGDKNSSMKAEVTNSLEKDVTFVACHASMQANHMSLSQLIPGVGTVPGGKREMVLRKQAGWTVLDQSDVK